MSGLKTTILLGLLTGLFLFIGSIAGGRDGIMIAFLLVVPMNLLMYWFSDKIILKMYGAREVAMNEAPWLYEIVQKLSGNAGLPMPKIYYIASPSPNAFATGRNPSHSAVAVTEGLIKLLNREEIEGVIAHEIAHIKNRDTLISVVAATIAGAIMMLARFLQWGAMFGGIGGRDDERNGGFLGLLLMAIITPIVAAIIQMAISRTREYQADYTGAMLSRKPWALANALEKLAYGSSRIPMPVNPATSHLFIVNPLRGKGFLNWFSTHPPIEERIARLRAMT